MFPCDMPDLASLSCISLSLTHGAFTYGYLLANALWYWAGETTLRSSASRQYRAVRRVSVRHYLGIRDLVWNVAP